MAVTAACGRDDLLEVGMGVCHAAGMVISLRYRQVDRDREAARQSASLAALAVILALVVAGLWLTDELRAEAGLQDCVLSGRMGCLAGVR